MSKEPEYGTGYNGDAAERERIISLSHTHRANDQIVQGVSWDGFRGCFIGCTLECYDRPKWSNAIGGPPQLPYLAESIFEGLPEIEAPDFHVEFLEAITCGANLDNVWHDFAEWLLVDERHGVVRFANEKGRLTIQTVADLHRKRSVDAAAWDAARAATAAYAAYAAYAAAYAAYAARAATAATAAYAAYASSTAATAVDDAHDDAAYAAREAARQAQRDKLLELVRGCEKAQ